MMVYEDGHRLRPLGEAHLLARLGLAASVVGAFFIVVVVLRQLGITNPIHPYLLFCVAVYLATRHFGAAAGLTATGLSTLLLLYVFVPPEYSLVLGAADLPDLALFVAVGLALVFVAETRTRALMDAGLQTRALDVVISELLQTAAPASYRIAIGIASRRNPYVLNALKLLVRPTLSDTLVAGQSISYVPLAAYLGDLVAAMTPAAAEHHFPIEAAVPEAILVSPSLAFAIGLLATELVDSTMDTATAQRPARIELRQETARLVLAVSTFGAHASHHGDGPFACKLVELLASKFEATVGRGTDNVTVTIPVRQISTPAGIILCVPSERDTLTSALPLSARYQGIPPLAGARYASPESLGTDLVQ